MNVISEPAIRQAMLALLVSYAVKNRLPPDDIPSVAQARDAARDEALGDAGDWIKTYVVKARPMEVLLTNDIWAGALAASGDGGDGTTAFGLKRNTFMKRVGQLGRRRGRETAQDGEKQRPRLGGLEAVD